jgi:hypothetical protein
MAQCQTEVNGLPILTGCPADAELLLVMNSQAAGNNNGYGLRYVKDVRQCWLQSLVFTFLQFTVGQGGAPISAGESSFTVDIDLLIEDSVNVVNGGQVMDRDDSTQVSYIPAYDSEEGVLTITFNQAVQNGQTYILTYAKAT